jgi:hypothetical protein
MRKGRACSAGSVLAIADVRAPTSIAEKMGRTHPGEYVSEDELLNREEDVVVEDCEECGADCVDPEGKTRAVMCQGPELGMPYAVAFVIIVAMESQKVAMKKPSLGW